MNATSVIRTLRDYSLITLGLVVYVLSWILFIIPHHLAGGGVTGISSLIYYGTGVPLYYSIFFINLVLFVIGFKILGKSFGVKSVFAVLMMTLLFAVIPPLVPEEFTKEFAVNGPLLSVIIGGLMSGFGVGICFSTGGSTGGTDIIAMIFNKYLHIMPGRVIIVCDLIIVGSSVFLTDTLGADISSSSSVMAQRIARVIYGYIMVAVEGFTLDFLLNGIKQAQQFMIFSDKYEEIADRITSEVQRGVSVFDATGWYTKKDRKIVFVICRKDEVNMVLRIVKDVDPKAFLSVASVSGAFGSGFDMINVKSSSQLLKFKKKQS